MNNFTKKQFSIIFMKGIDTHKIKINYNIIHKSIDITILQDKKINKLQHSFLY